jgi:hypothetical protein
MTNRVGACAALMEGLGGPTPDQPFMTPANRRVSALPSAVRWQHVVGRDRSCGWLDPPIVLKKHCSTWRTRRAPTWDKTAASV